MLSQIESTTLWDFPKQNYGDTPHGNNKYNGVTPAFVIWNLLQRYTKEGDLVVDPMCGSGTTIDVAKELKRKVIELGIAVPYAVADALAGLFEDTVDNLNIVKISREKLESKSNIHIDDKDIIDVEFEVNS